MKFLIKLAMKKYLRYKKQDYNEVIMQDIWESLASMVYHIG